MLHQYLLLLLLLGEALSGLLILWRLFRKEPLCDTLFWFWLLLTALLLSAG